VGLRRGERRLDLVRESNNVWSVTQPVRWRADQQSVDDMLKALAAWKAVAFVDGAELHVANEALAAPFCTLRLSAGKSAAEAASGAADAGDDGPLVIGVSTGASGAVYVRFETNATVRRLAASSLGVFGDDPLDPLAYRDRSVLAVPPSDVQRIALERGGAEQVVVRTAAGNWQPATASNAIVAQDVVNDVLYFVSNLRAIRAEAQNSPALAAYGLDPGMCVLTMGLMGGTGIQKSLVIGARAPTGGVYAMVKGQDVVFTISSSVIDMLARDLLSPLP
jgi:hypothetical protein